MESDNGKLFIGGISWDTDEQRLREYFSRYGEVVETVIMRDRATGRARGFGFIVFRDPSDAERVITEKHMIDGRMVEAKKAVPRDDQNMLNRNSSSIHSSSSPGRTKKIFVGGLPSSITENDFKRYFDQFGMITDVVVMYDHNTQRPRGFGFITFDSEEAVDRALQNKFHELNGKMVEVKKAVPKEMSPGPNRNPYVGHNNNNNIYGLNRSISFLNNIAQRHDVSSIGRLGLRMDVRYSPLSNSRNGFSALDNTLQGSGMNIEPGYVRTSAFGNNLGYGQMLEPYYNEALPNRYATPIRYNSGRNDSALSLNGRDVWGDGVPNAATDPASSGAYLSPLGGSFGVSLGKNVADWGPSSGQGRESIADYNKSGSVRYDCRDNNNRGYGRNSEMGAGARTSAFSGSNDYQTTIGELYRSGSVYADSTWQSSRVEVDGSSARSFTYSLDNIGSDFSTKASEGYVGSYSISNRGIAT